MNTNINNGTVRVKVDFYGDLRRFTISRSVSYAAFADELSALLGIPAHERKDKELVIKYVDEEKDLITMSSDLELKTALPVTQDILRLVVTFKNNPVPAPPMVINVQAAPYVPQIEKQQTEGETQPTPGDFGQGQPPCFFRGGGRRGGRGGMWGGGRGGWGGRGGMWGGGGHHPHPPFGFPQAYNPMMQGGGDFPYPQPKWDEKKWEKCEKKWEKKCERKERKCGKWRSVYEEAKSNGNAPAWMQNDQVLVQQIMQMGFDVHEWKVLKMLWKFNGDVNQVSQALLKRKERREMKFAKKCEKKCDKMQE